MWKFYNASTSDLVGARKLDPLPFALRGDVAEEKPRPPQCTLSVAMRNEGTKLSRSAPISRVADDWENGLEMN